MYKCVIGVCAAFSLLSPAGAVEREPAPHSDVHCVCARCNEELPFRFRLETVNAVGLDSMYRVSEAATADEIFDFPISKALGVPRPVGINLGTPARKDERRIFSFMIAQAL